MKKSLRFVGLDVHKDSVVMAVAGEGVVAVLPNDRVAIAKALDWVGPAKRLRVCYEAGRLASLPRAPGNRLRRGGAVVHSDATGLPGQDGPPRRRGVGTGDRDAQRHATAIGHDGSLDAKFTAIGGVFTAPPAAPWSWPRRVLASARRSRVARHTFADIFSRSDGRPGGGSIPESTDVPCWTSRTGAATPSTGSPCATERRFPWRRPAD
jgi:hypothetical protein